MKKLYYIVCAILLFWSSVACSPQDTSRMNTREHTPYEDVMGDYIENSLQENHVLRVVDYDLQASRYVLDFYEKRYYTPAWTADYRPNKQAYDVLMLLSEAQNYGLDTTLYHIDLLNRLHYRLNRLKPGSKQANMAMAYEFLLTNDALQMMSHLQNGFLYPDSAIYCYHHQKWADHFVQKLDEGLTANMVRKAILDCQPQTVRYQNLQRALTHFLQTNELNDSVIVIPNINDDSTTCYRRARQALIEFDYLKAEQRYNDHAFFRALTRFQKDNGLNGDSIIGFYTRKALLTSNYERYRQLVINLERLRWEQNLPDYYIYINIPSFTLELIKNRELLAQHRVITGIPYNPTPLMSSEVTYAQTYPAWHVPSRISSYEMLPRIKTDSNYLENHNLMVYDENRQPVDAQSVNWSEFSASNFNYFIAQRSGYYNSLGVIVFKFPNPYDVYLHDTNGRFLFSQDVRAYSHGCVRLDKPVDFAVLLLEQDGHASDVRELIENHKRRYLKLNQPVPLFIRYISALGNEQAKPVFYPDVYGYDQNLKNRLWDAFEKKRIQKTPMK